MADQVQINIGANAAGALAAFRSVGLAAKAMNATLAGVGIMAAAKAVQVATALPRTILKAIDDADAALRASQVAGMSVEDFSALSYAAGQAEISIADLEIASRYLAKTHNAALIPSLIVTAEEFAVMDDEVEKIRIATERFGKSGSNLIPFLNQGRAEISRLISEAKDVGAVMGEDFAVSADKFNDSWTKLTASLKGFALISAEFVLPALQYIVNGLTGVALAVKDLVEDNALLNLFKNIRDYLSDTVKYIAALVQGVARFTHDVDVAPIDASGKSGFFFKYVSGVGDVLKAKLDYASQPLVEVLKAARESGGIAANSEIIGRAASQSGTELAFGKSPTFKTGKRASFTMPESTASSAWTSRGFLNFGEVQLANRTLSYQKTVTAYLSELVNLQKQYLPDVANALS